MSREVPQKPLATLRMFSLLLNHQLRGYTVYALHFPVKQNPQSSRPCPLLTSSAPEPSLFLAQHLPSFCLLCQRLVSKILNVFLRPPNGLEIDFTHHWRNELYDPIIVPEHLSPLWRCPLQPFLGSSTTVFAVLLPSNTIADQEVATVKEIMEKTTEARILLYTSVIGERSSW